MPPEDDIAEAWASALEANEDDQPSEPEDSETHAVVEIKPQALLGISAGEDNLELLMDVPVTVSVEIGRTSLSIKEVLDLNPGSIVSLGKLAGEPMDLLVNGKRIAQGEIVIVDENFGIRDSFGIRVTNILANL